MGRATNVRFPQQIRRMIVPLGRPKAAAVEIARQRPLYAVSHRKRADRTQQNCGRFCYASAVEADRKLRHFTSDR